ncbi:MAG: bifunctional tetrahydrofolate synthase/dihydrofolate synthase, partial [Halomonadaceae bacterium]|nr:bifunctional tetrahydrofolate synthase/dihydrofolate synthase [Halomonadaceae bacterium]
SQELPASVYQAAQEQGAVSLSLGQAYHWQAQEPGSFSWSGTTDTGAVLRLDALPDPGLPLDNAATALQALLAAGIELNEADSRRALREVCVPGRMQWLGQWCLDVGHNPHAAAYVAERFTRQSCSGRTWVLLGMLEDKDAEGVVQALSGVADAWIAVSLAGERGRSAAELAGCIKAQGGRVAHQAVSPEAGAEWLTTRLAQNDRVLVCGSFFTVAAILAWKQA